VTEAPSSDLLVPFDGSFRIAKTATHPGEDKVYSKKRAKKELAVVVEKIEELQRVFYASDHHSLLLVFQAMDAAGKDGTIRAVTSGVNPAGFQVSSFKKPTTEELDHDFLWRCAKRLPERGRIGIFNRSWYEELLVVRVHPHFLAAQRIPGAEPSADLWRERSESIADFEKHLARQGTVIMKFFLNVSKDEQARRFIARADEPEKNWKFEPNDVKQRPHWDAYMEAFEDALNRTSKPWAPWYAVPADDKPMMRLRVAELILAQLEKLNLKFPKLSADDHREMKRLRSELKKELRDD
jgi:PPK2 family polyphosphate:nucleotide phosphotransferase